MKKGNQKKTLETTKNATTTTDNIKRNKNLGMKAQMDKWTDTKRKKRR